MFKKGQKMSDEVKRKISLSKKGKKLTQETRIKIGLAHKGKKRPPFSKEWRDKIAIKNRLRVGELSTINTADRRIKAEVEILRSQGFVAVPTGGKVIPDIVAFKDGKVFAFEVEYREPNYSKYTDEMKSYFNDIVWIIRKKNH